VKATAAILNGQACDVDTQTVETRVSETVEFDWEGETARNKPRADQSLAQEQKKEAKALKSLAPKQRGRV